MKRLLLALVLLSVPLTGAPPPGAMSEEQRIVYEFSHPKKPDLPRDRAILGKRSAPILIVAYSDFQCPYCRDGHVTIQKVRAKYGKKVAVVFKHFPLAFHPLALPAAKRFEAIALQSGKKAYEFHDAIFEGHERLSREGEPYLDAVAAKLGVNVAKMKRDMESETVRSRIRDDQSEARHMGLQGTPGFNVAGVTLRGAMPLPIFETIIDHKLGKRPLTVDSEPDTAAGAGRKPASPDN